MDEVGWKYLSSMCKYYASSLHCAPKVKYHKLLMVPLFGTPSIPNYKSFWLFWMHNFIYAPRYILCQNSVSKKARSNYSLEWKEQVISFKEPALAKFTYIFHFLQISILLADPYVPIFTFNNSKCNNYVVLYVLIAELTFFLLYIKD